jgi:hypothetical protein
MRTLALKAAAAAISVASTTAAALFVGAHLKNPNAPLRPSVVGPAAQSQASGGSLSLGPHVRSSDRPPVTSTYAS